MPLSTHPKQTEMSEQYTPRQRHKSRIAALQALYEFDVAGHDPELALARVQEEKELIQEAADFALELIRGVRAHISESDALIQRHAPLWPVSQLPAIDRNILRIAIFEMFSHNKVSVNIAIDEAVRLAKMFGSDTSPKFINGVLGTLSGKIGH